MRLWASTAQPSQAALAKNRPEGQCSSPAPLGCWRWRWLGRRGRPLGQLERRDVVLDEYFVGLSIGAGGRHIPETDCFCFGDDPLGTNANLQLPSSWTVMKRLAITFRGSVAFQFGSLALLTAQPCAEVPVLDERGERVHDHAGTEL
jgi:hypothetical protein